MNEQRREKETLKKQKKIILIVISSLVAFAIVCFLLTLIDFDSLFKKDTTNDTVTPENIYFYDESYSKYPSEDEWYMKETFREITYVYGSGTVFSETIITEDDAKAHGEPLQLLYNLIESIKAGNHETYNECFSSYYYKSASAQSKFTKQKIYDIIITEYPAETKVDNGVPFIEYTYSIEYRIRHNNGSLRKDIGSDHARRQYVKISNRAGEGILIDKIFTITETVITQ